MTLGMSLEWWYGDPGMRYGRETKDGSRRGGERKGLAGRKEVAAQRQVRKR